MSDQYLI